MNDFEISGYKLIIKNFLLLIYRERERIFIMKKFLMVVVLIAVASSVGTMAISGTKRTVDMTKADKIQKKQIEAKLIAKQKAEEAAKLAEEEAARLVEEEVVKNGN